MLLIITIIKYLPDSGVSIIFVRQKELLKQGKMNKSNKDGSVGTRSKGTLS